MKKKRLLICLLILALAAAGGTGAERNAPDGDGPETLPPYYREGDRLIIREGITLIGMDYEDSITVQPEDVECDSIDVSGGFGSDLRTIVFPSTLRGLGAEALVRPYLKELRLPGSLKWVSGWAIYYGAADRVILERDYAAGVPDGYGFRPGYWEVEEGNALYSARDGVLFSADGKVLLDYPCGKTDLHYDVPAGTEEIGPNAFGDSDMGIPLQTISLPVGLKKIGAWAFSGCGRLHSLTVPLTVTELDPEAFAQCVSLERLSLPPGLTVPESVEGAEQEDFSRYAGDNGATRTEPVNDGFGGRNAWEEAPASYTAWLSGEDGTGPVPLYPSKDAEEPSEEGRSGTETVVADVNGSRARILIRGWKEYWTDLKYLKPKNTETLFTVETAVPNDEGERALAEEGTEGAVFSWYDPDAMVCAFCVPGQEDEETLLAADQVTLYRERTGDRRELALLTVTPREAPIRFRDAPGGEAVSWTYSGEQAEILERDGEWARVRTAGGGGWVPETCLIVVEQAED